MEVGLLIKGNIGFKKYKNQAVVSRDFKVTQGQTRAKVGQLATSKIMEVL